jgi:phosphomannomutase / phosphoglucomutase
MTKINPFIFLAYDIRGLAVPAEDKGMISNIGGSPFPDLTQSSMELIGKGVATYIKRKYQAKNMLVGRDNRLHSEELQKAFIQGVISAGIDVIDGGLMTSPLMYYSVCKKQLDSGVNITASHNPKEYNGVKIVGKNAHSICGEELQEILKIIQNEDFETSRATIKQENDFFDIYAQDMIKRLKPSTQKHEQEPLKIVIDSGNAVAGKYAPDLFRMLGYNVTELHCELDGSFPNHEANPEEEKNMKDLSAKVKEIGADIGIGFDGDGDRVGVIDENGKFYTADYLLLFLAKELLQTQKSGQIIFDVKVSQIIINELKKMGGTPTMSKTGHSFIETKMHKLNAPLAGELSGHFFFGKPHYNYYGFDDAFFAAAKILEILTKSEKPFSKHFESLPKSFTTPEYKARCPDDKKFQIVKELTQHFTENYECITIDGVRINFDETSWGAVRSSNTSPNLTIRFEALTEKRLSEIQKIMIEQLRKHPEIDLSWYKEKTYEE